MATKPVSTYEHEPCIDKCNGCPQQIVDVGKGDTRHFICRVYVSPKAKFRGGNCPMAVHLTRDTSRKAGKINPLKASKKKARGKQ